MNNYRSVFSIGGDQNGDQFNRPKTPPAGSGQTPSPVADYSDKYFELLGAVRRFIVEGGKFSDLKIVYDHHQ